MGIDSQRGVNGAAKSAQPTGFEIRSYPAKRAGALLAGKLFRVYDCYAARSGRLFPRSPSTPGRRRNVISRLQFHFSQIFGVGSSKDRMSQVSIIAICGLTLIGIAFIYSAQLSVQGDYPLWRQAWFKQCVFAGLGFAAYWIVSRVKYNLILQYAHLIYAASIVALLLLETPLGVERYDARRWLDFKFFLFQPSEAAKIGTLVAVAGILSRSELGTLRESLVTLCKIAAVVALPILLIFRQPDLGSALVFPPMVFSLLLLTNLTTRFFTIVCSVGVVMLGIVAVDIYAYHQYMVKNGLSFMEDRGAYEAVSPLPLRDYQRNRVLAFVAPDAVDPGGTEVTWNLRQSLISVGSGGLTGKGWTEGTQARLGYLPQSVAHNDFIASVIAEEAGFLGSMLVLGLYFALLCNGLRIAGMARDRLGTHLAVGVTMMFLVHIFVNIGMTIGIMPITGLPLPFLSYGGSFILSCFILQGIIQSVYRYRRDYS